MSSVIHMTKTGILDIITTIYYISSDDYIKKAINHLYLELAAPILLFPIDPVDPEEDAPCIPEEPVTTISSLPIKEPKGKGLGFLIS